MNTVAKLRGGNPISELRSWLESDLGLGLSALPGLPLVRIEDFVEESTYVLRAELPGIDPDRDVEITLSDGVLTIAGERTEETKERGHSEFRYGSFSRSVSLPRGSKADEIVAEYRGGVLEVRVPLDESTPAPTKITVARTEE